MEAGLRRMPGAGIRVLSGSSGPPILWAMMRMFASRSRFWRGRWGLPVALGLLVLSGGGVLAASQHKENAQKFLAWVTGKGGQGILRDGTSFEYAVGNGEASNASLTPLADLHYPKVDPATLNSAKVTDLMTAAGLL